MSTLISAIIDAARWLIRNYFQLWKRASDNGKAVLGLGTLACLMACVWAYTAICGNTPAPRLEATAWPTQVAIAYTPAQNSTPAPTSTPAPSATPSPTDTPLPTTTAGPSPTPEPTDTPPPTRTPLDRLRGTIIAALGESNRDGLAKVVAVTQAEGGEIRIRFAIDDNVITSWLVLGAKEDVAKILKAVAQTPGLDYSAARIEGTFSMRDVYGNVAEDVVIDATYLPDTIGKINWGGFRAENVLVIADRKVVHPGFR